MQIVESEIVIPLKRQPDPKALVFLSVAALILIIGQFIYSSTIPLFNKSTAARDIQSDVVAFVFMLVAFGVLLTVSIRQIRAPSPYLRVSHEGIFTSRGVFLIRWADIKELSAPTRGHSHHLRIVLRNIREVNARANLYSRSFILTGIDERTLPISIDELLTTIQERFATELHEHHITIHE
ncbi:MAG: hypothetical protein J2P36_10610 [Ktedonobacteraceae bacterium]|nr:hypothetical protein [Ktedonobacteraceae bacterium]